MRSTVSIDVGAPAPLVFALARDVTRWPQLLPHYVRVDVEERLDGATVVARMVARRPLVALLGLGLPVAWRARAWSEPESLRLRFVHRGGATNGMDVTWRIEPTPTGARVSIDHDFRPRVGPWAWLIDRAFTKPIATRTLGTFKALAEALRDIGDVRVESERPLATKQLA
jgi:ribosome-associated toxin RatA of RatAB toxin-antitoxin module